MNCQAKGLGYLSEAARVLALPLSYRNDETSAVAEEAISEGS